MDYQQVRDCCLEQPGAFEDFPFGPDSAVYKVRARPGRTARMFALLWPERDGKTRVNLKCDPVLAEQLRAAHPEITPGYHMSKKHWNTVDCSGGLDEGTLRDLVEDSYDLVVASLPRTDREALHWTGLAGGPRLRILPAPVPAPLEGVPNESGRPRRTLGLRGPRRQRAPVPGRVGGLDRRGPGRAAHAGGPCAGPAGALRRRHRAARGHRGRPDPA